MIIKKIVHGTLNAYQYHKCSCARCRRANAERSRQAYHRKKMRTWSSRERRA